MESGALIIFIKNPVAGKVKTRLAATIGDTNALAVYHKLLNHTRMQSSQSKAECYLYYDQEIADDDWSSAHFNKKVQAQGDLGQRMETAFEEVLKAHDKVIIIGSDCPEITSGIIDEALEQLELVDVVIGPTLDGGYYLLGMKSVYPFLFRDMPWSTEEVYSKTVKCIQKEGLLYSLMPILSDLDYEEDLLKFPHLLN